MNNKIDVRQFNFFYGASQALIDLNLPVRENQITALIGPSGCGKSTFLRSLNRMNDTIRGTRATGEVLLDGKNVYDPDVDVVDLRQRVGMVFQRPNPFPQSIYDNVAFGPRVLGTNKKGDLDAIVEASLQSASLWDEVRHRLNEPAFDLNPGQQQRLCIARTIAVKPEVILMDEPCSALDPVATLRVEDLMRELAQQYTIVIVTHNMQQAARASDWTGFFWLGRLVEFDQTNTLFSSPREELTEAYITGRRGVEFDPRRSGMTTSIRHRFEMQLNELREDVLKMGSMVEEELHLAMDALEALDTAKAKQVYVADDAVNATRFEIEEKCFALIVTQQPAARDLRSIVTVMNMIIDLERMGDQAKGIAKVVPHMVRSTDIPRPPDVKEMGRLAGKMLNQAMTAYAHDNVDLAKMVARQDDEVDALYAKIFHQLMGYMAQMETAEKIEAAYEALRAARELERFADLATNIAERVIYMVTGKIQEMNVDRSDAAE